MAKKWPCRVCAQHITSEELQDAIQLFTSSQSQSDSFDAFMDITTCLGSYQSLESPPYDYHERRKEFMSEVSKDPKIAQKLSDILKYEKGIPHLDYVKKILWILDMLVENKIGVHKNIYHQSLLMLMEKGVFVNLILRIEVFSDATQRENWNGISRTLMNYMWTDLQETNIHERSIYYKSKNFEKISIIVNAAEIVGDCRRIVMCIYVIYSHFTDIIAGVEYCRSMVRSQVQDGTMRKMAQLVSQHSQVEEVLKIISFHYTQIFLYLTMIDKNTVYNKPCKKIVDELRLIAPILIKILSLNWKGGSKADRSTALAALKILEHYVIISSNEVDHKFLKRQKLSKSLPNLMLWEMRSSHGDLSQTTELLKLSYSLFISSLRCLEIEHLRPLIPYLIKSMRQDNCRLSSEEESLLLVSNNITCLMVYNCTGLEEGFMNEILRMKLIPAWVSVIQRYHMSMEKHHLAVTVDIVFNMCKLVGIAANEHLLTLIDQVITSFPLLIQYILTKSDGLDLEAFPSPNFSMASWLGKLFLMVTNRLTHIYDDKLASIDSQLDALVDSDFVLGIGKALITFEDHQIVMQFLKVCADLFHAADNRKIMRKLVVFLPDIIERCKQLEPFYRDAKDAENIYHQMYEPMMRKAIAYAIEDVSPTVLQEEHIVESILTWWAPVTLNLSNQRIQYPVQRAFGLNDEEYYYDGDAIVDMLRATWAICQHYPHKILEIMDPDSILLKGCFTNEQGAKKFMQLVLQLVASYLDHSEEYSKNFLMHITAFVRDLDINPLDDICNSLLAACHRFLEIQSDQELVHNVCTFTEAPLHNLIDLWINS